MVEADIRTQQRLYGIEYPGVCTELQEGLVALDRVIDPPGNSLAVLQLRLQLEDGLVAAGEGIFNESIDRFVQ